MTELGSESRALLDAARHGDGIGRADRARIRAKLHQRIGAAVALGSVLTASASLAHAARPALFATLGNWFAATAKLLGVVAVVGATGFGVAHVSGHFGHASESTVAKPSPVRVAPRVVSPALDPAPRDPAQVPTQSAEPSRAAIAPPQRSNAVTKALPNAGRTPPSDVATPLDDPLEDGLVGQVAAIRESRAALRRGDGRAALALLNQGVPAGQAGPLEQEAQFARISALCLTGDRAQARLEAERFLARFPDSLLGSKIRASCAYAAADAAPSAR